MIERRHFLFSNAPDRLKISLYSIQGAEESPRCLPGCEKGGLWTRRCWRGKGVDSSSPLLAHALGRKAAGLAGSNETPFLTHHAPGAEQCVGAGPAGRGRAARDPPRARGGTDPGGLSGPHSRGLYDTALARGTGRGWLRGRRPLQDVHLAVSRELSSLARNRKYRACALRRDSWPWQVPRRLSEGR